MVEGCHWSDSPWDAAAPNPKPRRSFMSFLRRLVPSSRSGGAGEVDEQAELWRLEEGVWTSYGSTAEGPAAARGGRGDNGAGSDGGDGV